MAGGSLAGFPGGPSTRPPGSIGVTRGWVAPLGLCKISKEKGSAKSSHLGWGRKAWTPVLKMVPFSAGEDLG